MNEREIFLAAIEIADPARRAAHVEQACGSDAKLRAQVEELLKTHAQSSQFLETPAVATDASVAQTLVTDSSATDDDPRAERASAEGEIHKYLQPATRTGWLGRLGHYEIEAILGRGAFGIVAKAFDEKLHRVVAIKLMNPELASTSPPRKRFLREARTAAAVMHENIVAIHAVEEEPIPYLVMEYIPGQTLQQFMDTQGPLDVPEILRIGQQVASGLAAAHAANLIHRDIKPSNILLTGGPNERAKISDFGLARAVDDATMTSSGLIAGTPMYMAPEQARGETLDHRADLFSLGSVLYQMASGRPPFRAANTVAVLKRVCEDTPRPLADVLPGIPGWLETIIFRLLEKDRDDRYQTAQEVAELLARCQSELQHQGHVTCVPGRPSAAAETRVFPAPASDRSVSRRWHIGWLAGGMLTVAALIGLLLLNFAKNPEVSAVKSPAETTTTATMQNPAETPPVAGWHGWPADAPKPAIAPFNAEQAKQHQEEWAAYLKVPVEYTNSIGMKFRLIPPGEFTMGSNEIEVEAALANAVGNKEWMEHIRSERPAHRVVLTQPFYLGRHEVTQSQFASVTGANPSQYASTGKQREIVEGMDTATHPVEMVAWDDGFTFCNQLSRSEGLEMAFDPSATPASLRLKAGYRLPTEGEWEFACRAGTDTRFWTGDDPAQLAEAAWFQEPIRTQPVGLLKANPFGLHDVHGNVWEWVFDNWTSDYYATSARQPTINPTGPEASSIRVIRGGLFFFNPAACRSAGRHATAPAFKHESMGFRAAVSVDAVRQAMKVMGPTTSPKPLNDYFARHRRAAERALAVGGEVFVETVKTAEFRAVKAGQSLPDEPFVVVMWSIKNSTTATNGDLDVLAGLRHLQQLNLMANGRLDADIIPKLAAMRSPVKELGIGHINLKTSVLDQLPVMPNVHLLWLSSEQVDDGWRFLRRFPGLRSIELYGAPIPDLSPLGDVPHLRYIRLTACGEPPAAALIRDIQTRHPQLRILYQLENELRFLGTDPARVAARRFIEAGIPEFRDDGAGSRRELRVEEIEQTVALRYLVPEIPRGIALTDELRGLLTHVNLQGFKAEGLRGTDSLVPVLSGRHDIDHLTLTDSDLTDEGLRRLQSLRGLRGLYIKGTKVSAAGVAAFHRAVPDCRVQSDTGNTDPDYSAIP